MYTNFWEIGPGQWPPAAVAAALALTALWLFLLRKVLFRTGQDLRAFPDPCVGAGRDLRDAPDLHAPGRERLFWLRAALAVILGAALFTPSIGAVQVPLQEALSAWLARHTTLADPFLLALPVVFLSGLIQEPVKLLALLPAACRAPRSSYLPLGALAGGAYGGMEALLLFAAVFPHPGLGALNLAAAIWERAFAILFHLALAAFVAHRFSRGWKQGLGALALAVLAHSLLLNYVAAVLLPALWGGLASLLYVTLVSLAAAFYLRRIVEHDCKQTLL